MAEVNIGGLPPHSRSLRINKGGLIVEQDLIKDVVQGMLPYLNNAQSERLQEVLKHPRKLRGNRKQATRKISRAELCRTVLIGKANRGLF